MSVARSKPYFYAKWIADLLGGDSNCEWKVWFKAHFQKYDTIKRDGDNLAEWEIEHTALLNKLIAEYKIISDRVLVEGETKWTVTGTSADLGGKMDLIAVEPNVVIDAKTGKEKTSHAAQIKIYLMAIAMGALPVKGNFTGIVAYADKEVPVAPPDEQFKSQFAALIKRLALHEPAPVPSKWECAFCDIADCAVRFKEEPSVKTELF